MGNLPWRKEKQLWKGCLTLQGITPGIVIRPGDVTYPGNLLEEPDGCRESLNVCECDTQELMAEKLVLYGVPGLEKLWCTSAAFPALLHRCLGKCYPKPSCLFAKQETLILCKHYFPFMTCRMADADPIDLFSQCCESTSIKAFGVHAAKSCATSCEFFSLQHFILGQ